MIDERIDFISAYCDRWCERCGFTNRCSAYACQIAIAMCGDEEAGIELAVGRPQPVGREKEKSVGERLMEEMESAMPSETELAAAEHEEEERRKRIDSDPLTESAETYLQVALAWLKDHSERVRSIAEPAVRDALEIISWDVFFIGAKLRRALGGRDRRHEEDWDDDPIQNDWNGSAKVALISLARSETAWQAVANLPDNGGAAIVVDTITRLRMGANRQFPDAMRFKRPGFDEISPADETGRIR
jgi:hypothetical protein